LIGFHSFDNDVYQMAREGVSSGMRYALNETTIVVFKHQQ
jgi:hypothetical protein